MALSLVVFQVRAAPRSSAVDLWATADVHWHAVRRCVDQLVNAINGMNYEIAWMWASELRHSVHAAESQITRLVASPDYLAVTARWSALRCVAGRVLLAAPRPSVAAIAQARSTDWWADRGAWIQEERQWIQQRRSAGPIQVTYQRGAFLSRSSQIGAR